MKKTDAMHPLILAAFMTFALATASAWAAELHLKVASFTDANHKYYHHLLEESLKSAGHTVKMDAEGNLPQLRIAAYLDEGRLSLHWFLQTQERDARYVRVDHKLTQGLIGQRIMLIPKGDEAVYAKVKTLDDLKATGKVAGMGKGWFDVLIWLENGLAVREPTSDWRQLYPMVADKGRGVDYFPRGASEIMRESQDNPVLAIEPNLLLVYPRDFVFYLSKADAALKPVIEAALKQAEKSGLQKKLMDEYFGPSIASLNLNKRVRINLKNATSN